MGVVSADGRYRLIDSGPLPEAVAASAAIPFVFEPLHIPGQALLCLFQMTLIFMLLCIPAAAQAESLMLVNFTRDLMLWAPCTSRTSLSPG